MLPPGTAGYSKIAQIHCKPSYSKRPPFPHILSLDTMMHPIASRCPCTCCTDNGENSAAHSDPISNTDLGWATCTPLRAARKTGRSAPGPKTSDVPPPSKELLRQSASSDQLPRPRAEAQPPPHLVKGRGQGGSPLGPNASGAGGGDGYWPFWWFLLRHLWPF